MFSMRLESSKLLYRDSRNLSFGLPEKDGPLSAKYKHGMVDTVLVVIVG